MGISKHPYEREFDRFLETEEGETAVRVSDPAAVDTFQAQMVAILTCLQSIDDTMNRILNHQRYLTGIEEDRGEEY